MRARYEVFTVMAGFVEMLPFATDRGEHDAAVEFFVSFYNSYRREAYRAASNQVGGALEGPQESVGAEQHMYDSSLPSSYIC